MVRGGFLVAAVVLALWLSVSSASNPHRELLDALQQLETARQMRAHARELLERQGLSPQQINGVLSGSHGLTAGGALVSKGASGENVDVADKQVAFDIGGAIQGAGKVVDGVKGLVGKIKDLFGGGGSGGGGGSQLGQNQFTQELDQKEQKLQGDVDSNISSLKDLVKKALQMLGIAWGDDSDEGSGQGQGQGGQGGQGGEQGPGQGGPGGMFGHNPADRQMMMDRDMARRAEAEFDRQMRNGPSKRELEAEAEAEMEKMRKAKLLEQQEEKEAERLERENALAGGKGKGGGRDGKEGIDPAEFRRKSLAEEAAELAQWKARRDAEERKLREDEERLKQEEQRKIAALRAFAEQDKLRKAMLRAQHMAEHQCEVGPWHHVHRLLIEGALLAANVPGDKCHLDEFGPHESPAENIAAATRGHRAHVPHHHLSPGGVMCLSTQLAEVVLSVARFGKPLVVSIHGEHHNCQKDEAIYNNRALAHRGGSTMAVVFGQLNGKILDRENAEDALKVVEACKAAGATAVFNINLHCGCECKKYTHSVLCAL